MRFSQPNVRHLRIKHDLLQVGILTLVVAVFWIAIAVHATYTKQEIPADLESLTQKFDPTLDIAVIESLPQRYSPPDTFEGAPPPTETPVTNPTPIATSSSPLLL